MIESEIVATGSVKGILNGKHYNRCIRAHKIIYVAMQRLRSVAFQDYLADQEANELCSLGIDLLDCKNKSLPGFCSNDRNFLAWKEAFDHFVNERSKESPTFALPGPLTSTWCSCCFCSFERHERQIGSYIYQLCDP